MSGGFVAQVQVRWGDSDRLGHVNNTRFTEYMQEARVQFLSAKLTALGLQSGPLVVRKTSVEFLRPVTDSSGPLEIEVYLTHLGTSSFTVWHSIRDNTGAECAFGDAVMVGFDLETETARPLSEAERAVLGETLVQLTSS